MEKKTGQPFVYVRWCMHVLSDPKFPYFLWKVLLIKLSTNTLPVIVSLNFCMCLCYLTFRRMLHDIKLCCSLHTQHVAKHMEKTNTVSTNHPKYVTLQSSETYFSQRSERTRHACKFNWPLITN